MHLQLHMFAVQLCLISVIQVRHISVYVYLVWNSPFRFHFPTSICFVLQHPHIWQVQQVTGWCWEAAGPKLWSRRSAFSIQDSWQTWYNGRCEWKFQRLFKWTLKNCGNTWNALPFESKNAYQQCFRRRESEKERERGEGEELLFQWGFNAGIHSRYLILKYHRDS